jgi:hypothetical protein
MLSQATITVALGNIYEQADNRHNQRLPYDLYWCLRCAADYRGVRLRVLIGCEESGVVRRAFRGYGHDATSCDVLPARDKGLDHYEGDVLHLLGDSHWDLIILHPPCQYIAVSGNRWHAGSDERDKALCWTEKLWNIARDVCPRVCLENPVGLTLLPDKPQWIQPWQYGHPTTKKTGLWLHGLPPLVPSDIVTPNSNVVHRMPPGPNRSRDRATTYLGIAEAMASQWGAL